MKTILKMVSGLSALSFGSLALAHGDHHQQGTLTTLIHYLGSWEHNLATVLMVLSVICAMWCYARLQSDSQSRTGSWLPGSMALGSAVASVWLFVGA